MTHVVLNMPTDSSGHFEVDGLDLSDCISADHVRIEYPQVGPALVHVAFLADRLDVTHDEDTARTFTEVLTDAMRRPEKDGNPVQDDKDVTMEDFLYELRRDVDRLMAAVEHLPSHTGATVGDAINAATSKAKRRGRK